MIRLATRSDLNTITDLVLEFLQATSYGDWARSADKEHIRRLCYVALHQGYIWLAEIDSVAVGLLIAVREQNIWVPDCYQLRELVWYVREEYRRSAATGRLFVRFCQKADELLELGEIDGYFTTRMGSTPDYTLEDRGFRATETLYLKTREGM